MLQLLASSSQSQPKDRQTMQLLREPKPEGPQGSTTAKKNLIDTELSELCRSSSYAAKFYFFNINSYSNSCLLLNEHFFIIFICDIIKHSCFKCIHIIIKLKTSKVWK